MNSQSQFDCFVSPEEWSEILTNVKNSIEMTSDEKWQEIMLESNKELPVCGQETSIQLCQHCNFYLFHPTWGFKGTDQHMTCLCLALEHNSICCEIGYENLLSSIPKLCTHFLKRLNLPEVYNHDVFNAWESKMNKIEISTERSQNIRSKCLMITNKISMTPPKHGAMVIEHVDTDNDPFFYDINYCIHSNSNLYTTPM